MCFKMFHFHQGMFYVCFNIVALPKALVSQCVHLSWQATIQASSVLHNNLFQKVLHSPMLFFETNPIGRMQNVFSRDMDEGLLSDKKNITYLICSAFAWIKGTKFGATFIKLFLFVSFCSWFQITSNSWKYYKQLLYLGLCFIVHLHCLPMVLHCLYSS